MDRTNEFIKLVYTMEIPQMDALDSTFGHSLHLKEKKLLETTKQIEKTSAYEKYKIQPLISQSYKILEEMKGEIMEIKGTGDQKEVYKNMNDIIKTKVLRYTIKLKGLAKKYEGMDTTAAKRQETTTTKPQFNQGGNRPQFNQGNTKNQQNTNQLNTIEAYNEQPQSFSTPQYTDQVIQEEIERAPVQSEQFQQRRRIVNRISEMGDIMENISLHVSLQEMELKRIDDIMGKSEHFGQKTINDLKETWEMISGRRKTMIKFFMGWMLLILTFWFIKRR